MPLVFFMVAVFLHLNIGEVVPDSSYTLGQSKMPVEIENDEFDESIGEMLWMN
jgi:hypothetical protein